MLADLTALDLAVVFLVGSLAVGRITRLFVDDDMPLFKWFREQWIVRAPEAWKELITCGFCVGIYVGFASALWAFLSELHWTWWFAHLWFAASYLGAIINARDIPSDQ